jgi:signal transduction histidine kinase
MGAYLVFQLIWWGYQLFKLHKQQLQNLSDQGLAVAPHALQAKVYMIIGEGLVFLIFLGVGFWWIRKNVWRDLQAAQKEKTFLLAITHELKTPVAAIKLNSQTLVQRSLTEEQQRKIHSDIQKEANRLNTLVNNVLLATQMENNSVHPHITSSDLTQVLDHVIRRFELLHPNRNIKAILERNILWNTDEELFSSAVANLIENAHKYSPSNTSIEVRLFQSAGLPNVEVADNGIGIPDEEKQLVFQKFYRLGDENRRVSKGTGLGLFIVKEICNQLNASVQLVNNGENGSRFVITFKS